MPTHQIRPYKENLKAMAITGRGFQHIKLIFAQ